MGIPSIILHNVINGHAVNLTLDQPIDREITVFFPMVPGKDTITLISDEYLTTKITAEVTNQVNTVVMQKVTDEINNQFATTIMPKIEQTIIDYDQNVTARFNDVNQSIQDLETKVTDITNNAINGLTVKLDQEIIDRKEGDRILEEKIQEIYNIFDSKPNDNIDGTITDMQETMKKLIHIGKDSSFFLSTNPDYNGTPITLPLLTAFESGSLRKISLETLSCNGKKDNLSDKEVIYKEIITQSRYNSKVVINRNKPLSKIVDDINRDIKTLGVSLNRVVPTGTIIALPYNGDNDPEINRNYLKCDGKYVPVKHYSDLALKLGYGYKDLDTYMSHPAVLCYLDDLKNRQYIQETIVRSSFYSESYNKNSLYGELPSNSFMLHYLSNECTAPVLIADTRVGTGNNGFVLQRRAAGNKNVRFDFLNGSGKLELMKKNKLVFLFHGNTIVDSVYAAFINQGDFFGGYFSSYVLNNEEERNTKYVNKIINLDGNASNQTQAITIPLDVNEQSQDLGFITVDTVDTKPDIFNVISNNLKLDRIHSLYGLLYTDTYDTPTEIGESLVGDLVDYLQFVLQLGKKDTDKTPCLNIAKSLFSLNQTQMKKTVELPNGILYVRQRAGNIDLATDPDIDNNLIATLDKQLNFIKVKSNTDEKYYFTSVSQTPNDTACDKLLNSTYVKNRLIKGKKTTDNDQVVELMISLKSTRVEINVLDMNPQNEIIYSAVDLNEVREKTPQEFSLERLYKEGSKGLKSGNLNKNSAFTLDLKQFVSLYNDVYNSEFNILETVFSNYDVYGKNPSNPPVWAHKLTNNRDTNLELLFHGKNNTGVLQLFTSDGTGNTNPQWAMDWLEFLNIINSGTTDPDGFYFLLTVTDVDTKEHLTTKIGFVPYVNDNDVELIDIDSYSLPSDIDSLHGSINNNNKPRIMSLDIKNRSNIQIVVYPLNNFKETDWYSTKPGMKPVDSNYSTLYVENRLRGLVLFHSFKYGYFSTENTNTLNAIMFTNKDQYNAVFGTSRLLNTPLVDIYNSYVSNSPIYQPMETVSYDLGGEYTGTTDTNFEYAVNGNVIEYTYNRQKSTIDLSNFVSNFSQPANDYYIELRTCLLEVGSNNVLVSDSEFPILLYCTKNNSTVGNGFSLDIPGAKHISLSNRNVVSTITINVNGKKFYPFVLVTYTFQLKKKLSLNNGTFQIPDLRDDFLRHDERNLGLKQTWTIPQIQGSFKIAGTSAGFDSHQGVFQPGSSGTFPANSTGNSGGRAIFDLNNLPSYRKHTNSDGKMHPDYTGVQYWIKF